jgi:hypothetical protein
MQYLSVFSGVASASTGEPTAVHVPSAIAGDVAKSIVVISGTNTSNPVGNDVTGDFVSPIIQQVPLTANINFAGAYLLQTSGVDLSNTVLLALMQRGAA